MKRIAAILLFAIVFMSFGAPASAQERGIVPAATANFDCRSSEVAAALKSKRQFTQRVGASSANRREQLSNLLSCAVKSGDVRLFMLPFFVTYLVQFLLQLAGIVAILFIVIGGYYYVLGGLGEDKEKGKKTIRSAILGLIVALSGWVIVNFIQVALTS